MTTMCALSITHVTPFLLPMWRPFYYPCDALSMLSDIIFCTSRTACVIIVRVSEHCLSVSPANDLGRDVIIHIVGHISSSNESRLNRVCMVHEVFRSNRSQELYAWSSHTRVMWKFPEYGARKKTFVYPMRRTRSALVRNTRRCLSYEV